MTVVTTLDIDGLTAPEHRAVIDELGVEERLSQASTCTTAPPESAFGSSKSGTTEGFDRFLEARLVPAGETVGARREMVITVKPLHNFSQRGERAARLDQLSARSTRQGGAHLSRNLERREIP